ncbi:RagB/SusD family nutrient uptake outer membrane protein [Bacteroides thetaiotaomicron]|nr:RagB/SusD family nutrient uptake outer membrane protein [Bacteroides thetaiotaomicron]
MKKILKKSLHILCTTLGIIPFMLTSCNYLAVDEYFNDLTPLDSIFARQDYLERYVWGTAALMPAQGNLFSGSYGPYETAVDEVLLSWQKAEYAGTYLYADKITQNDSYYNMWGQYYKGIRKCNTIFTRIDECKDLKGLDRREIMGLTHFMRAFLLFLSVGALRTGSHPSRRAAVGR